MGPARLALPLAALLALGPAAEAAGAADAGVAAVELPTFDPIFQNDSAVRSVVARLGLPDRAEVVPLAVGPPWEAYELRAYYDRVGQMLVFMRANVACDEDVSILRYQGPIPPSLAAAPTVVAAAAFDPDRAAAEAEARAAAAERAADRAEAITAAMDRRFKRSLVKR
jgi:hypothetical protein